MDGPFRSVGEFLGIDKSRLHEPVTRLVLAAGGKQHLGIGVPNSRRPRIRRFRIQFLAFERRDRSIKLSHVTARSRCDDAHFHAAFDIEATDILRSCECERPFGASQSALTIGHDRQVVRSTGDSGVCAEFGKRFCPLLAMVCGDTACFAHNGDASTAAPRGPCMRQTELPILGFHGVEGASEMLHKETAEAGRQRLEFSEHRLRKDRDVDVFRNRRQLLEISAALGAGVLDVARRTFTERATTIVRAERAALSPTTVVIAARTTIISGGTAITITERTAFTTIVITPRTPIIAARATITVRERATTIVVTTRTTIISGGTAITITERTAFTTIFITTRTPVIITA